ncbi:hypothetical protein A6A08_08850 [Nocardiopsis sp. TSRI0078]|uniref:MerR family transcriptional regulator n=1 Tax=unclassified Nocardiopsis TaxID=2649073 RepID=UPI00093C5A55|nr:MerR family transcriptional regulator [Nocardiopsis sp. TSRI0078]OKI15674.1 hypothetical protein A6A08_08850 [Nocardiopsis sp. TSRI0078]
MSAARPDPDRALYTISVAADLVGISAQSLRLYEQRGLLRPARTDGGTRLYSDNDIALLRRISDLVDQGVNLTGVARIIELQEENTRLHGGGPARRNLDGQGAGPGAARAPEPDPGRSLPGSGP